MLLTNMQKDKQLEQITYLEYRHSCVLHYIYCVHPPHLNTSSSVGACLVFVSYYKDIFSKCNY